MIEIFETAVHEGVELVAVKCSDCSRCYLDKWCSTPGTASAPRSCIPGRRADRNDIIWVLPDVAARARITGELP